MANMKVGTVKSVGSDKTDEPYVATLLLLNWQTDLPFTVFERLCSRSR